VKGQRLEDLYRKYAKPLYFYLYKLCGSKQLAEDLTQETFVRATIHLHLYDETEPRAWLFKVARNTYIDEWRKQTKRQKILKWFFLNKEEMISPYGIPEENLMHKELQQELENLMVFLPENYRSILYLREVEQFSYQEIMATLQLSEEQVKVTLYRARKRLSELAQKKGWDYGSVE